MKTIVVIPTYDEKDNVRPMAEAVLKANEAGVGEVEVLFVDDNSPDGTGKVVDEMAAKDGRIRCLHRTKKEGLGKAYVAGFKAALATGADKVVQMDCDFSHDPKDLPRMIAEDADLTIGSRYVKGGSTPGWPFKRRLVSRLGGIFIRTVTGMRIKDPTGGFKCWKRGTLEKLDLDSVESAGYSFQLEMNNRASRGGFAVREIPIVFTDRVAGYSKITAGIAVESVKVSLKLARWKRGGVCETQVVSHHDGCGAQGKIGAVAAVASASALLTAGCASMVVERDVVVYGSSPAALTTAIAAQKAGKSVVIVCPEQRIGGLTTGGLGQTDIGNKAAFGGLALQFYRDVADYYKNEAHWTRQKRSDYLPDGQCSGSLGEDSMWTFEPHAALEILEGWERKYGLAIMRGEWLDRSGAGVSVSNGTITAFRTLSKREYRGKVFVDATYEGDLMAAAGVSYFVGREPNAKYGETIGGIEFREARSHQFFPGVDPYVVKGDRSSGLLPNVEPYDPDEKDGDGDSRVQAYCFRMCLTDDPGNRIPFAKPAGYDERDYELLLRNFEAQSAEELKDPWGNGGFPWINSKMPNRKTDTNNRTGFSTDFIGRNWAWPEASYAEREKIRKAHLDYQRGLMWTLANHPRVPERIRSEVSRWGTCRDEFADGLGDGWQSQLYVREARRLVGEVVMTEHHCRGDAKVARPVALGAYGMDSHHVRRHVGADGFVHNEGDVQDYKLYSSWGDRAHLNPKEWWKGRFAPYGIDYGAIVPKRAECGNLFVPVCLSASHMAFGSIRMEPVFFALGQVAGTAAAMAIDGGGAVQDVDYGKLAARLKADGQVLEWAE